MNQLPLPMAPKPQPPPPEPPPSPLPEPLPLKRRHRKGDPRTSVEAARKQISASPEVMRIVEEIMKDCVSRSDHEIWEEFQRRGHKWTPDAIRHARLVFAEVGLLKELDFTRMTPVKCATRVWVYDPETADRLSKEVDSPEEACATPVSKPTKDEILSALDELQSRDTPENPFSDGLKTVMTWIRKKYDKKKG